MHSMHLAGVRRVQLVHLSCGRRSTLRRAPSQSGCQRRHRRSSCQWCGCRGPLSSQGSGESLPHGFADAVMNGVMPVVIVVGVVSVPAAVVRLKRVMRPANTGIGAPNHNSLPGETELPHLRRVRVINSWFNRLRYPRPRRRFSAPNRVEEGNF